MTDTDLITALGRIAVQDQHRCLGCGYEHNCGIHGCQIIRAAADRLKELAGKDSNVPTKTAAEMFRELGYTRKGETNGGGIRYDGGERYNKENPEKSIVINPDKVAKGVFPDGFGKGFTKQEILACAQLIKEMRESM